MILQLFAANFTYIILEIFYSNANLNYKIFFNGQEFFDQQYHDEIKILDKQNSKLEKKSRTIDELEPQNVLYFVSNFGRSPENRVLVRRTALDLIDVCYIFYV